MDTEKVAKAMADAMDAELTAEKLKEIGVKAPIEITADNAFTTDPNRCISGF